MKKFAVAGLASSAQATTTEAKDAEMVDQVIGERFENVLAKGDELLTRYSRQEDRGVSISMGPFVEWRTQSLTLLQAVLGADHVYTREFDISTGFREGWGAPSPYHVDAGLGTLRSANEDHCKGWTWVLKERVHADVFDDFLEMAESLVSDGYKDAAAVIAGSTLEEHLRKLCQKNGIDTIVQKSSGSSEPQKSTTMNNELRDQGAYNQIAWRSMQGWLDIRNSAAHGKYGDYSKDQTTNMIVGIRDFIGRNPA